jgi:hypothetical protein
MSATSFASGHATNLRVVPDRSHPRTAPSSTGGLAGRTMRRAMSARARRWAGAERPASPIKPPLALQPRRRLIHRRPAERNWTSAALVGHGWSGIFRSPPRHATAAAHLCAQNRWTTKRWRPRRTLA